MKFLRRENEFVFTMTAGTAVILHISTHTLLPCVSFVFLSFFVRVVVEVESHDYSDAENPLGQKHVLTSRFLLFLFS